MRCLTKTKTPQTLGMRKTPFSANQNLLFFLEDDAIDKKTGLLKTSPSPLPRADHMKK